MRDKHGHRIAFPFFVPDGAGSGAGGAAREAALGGEEHLGDAVGAGAEPEQQQPDAPVSFDDLLNGNKDYQSAHDKKVAQALTTAKKKWEQQHLDDLDEATKLEKMNETQRKEYRLNKDRAALDAERAKFARHQLQVSVGAELQKRGLSADFARYLTGEDSDTSQAAIDTFEGLWNASLATAVNGRMRANPPKDPNPAVDYSKMSDEEYYAATMKKKE